MPCPACEASAPRVHSRYERVVRDLPWRGTPMRIRFLVRRFFCDNVGCGCRIFTEQLPEVVERYGRCTARFDIALTRIGLECGGEPGGRLSKKLGIPTSGDTILGRLRSLSLPDIPGSEVIGIDDFALRRGQRYGTIIVDHTTGRPIDLLPDREGSTVARWLRSRPSPAFVTRDRSAGYAGAITAGAPEAIQIADRWHLLANAREALVRLLDRHHATITQLSRQVRDENQATLQPTTEASAYEPLVETIVASNALPAAESLKAEPSPASVPVPPSRQREMDLSAARRARRLARYELVMELHTQGYSHRAISRKLRIGKATVGKYLKAGVFPERAQPRRKRLADAFVKTLKTLWNAGIRNANILYKRIADKGFAGSHHAVRRYVARWRTPQDRKNLSGTRGLLKPEIPLVRPSSNRLAWLLIRPELQRHPEETRLEALLMESSGVIASAVQLVCEFGTVIRERHLLKLKRWLSQATKNKVADEIRRFAGGIQRDWKEVSAAVTCPYSNGRTEGHVNRLKLIKRKMYGRAKFDLLRIRVLAAGP